MPNAFSFLDGREGEKLGHDDEWTFAHSRHYFVATQARSYDPVIGWRKGNGAASNWLAGWRSQMWQGMAVVLDTSCYPVLWCSSFGNNTRL